MQRKIKASRRASNIDYSIREVLVPAAKVAERIGEDALFRFNIGDPNKWDFDTPEYFKRALMQSVWHTDNGYGDSQGNLNLRQAICDREFEKNGVHIIPEDVYVTAGVSEGIQMLLGALVEPGDQILAPGPSYPTYQIYSCYNDCEYVPYRTIEEEGWAPDIDDIEKKIAKDKVRAIVVVNPNNPTGAVYPEKELRAIGDLAANYGVPIISDEIYDKIVFDGEFFSMSRLPSDVPRIIMNGFSKVNLMPGWRQGYCYFMDEDGMLDEIREAMMKQFRARICVNVPCQEAARVSLQGPQDYIVDMNRKLKERADFTYKRMNEIPGLSTQRTCGALYSFPKIECDDWATDKEFVIDCMEHTGIVFVHGSGFDETYGRGHFRTILLPPMETLDAAYDKLEKFMLKHQ